MTEKNSSTAVKGLPWFRAYEEFAHDPKVQMMNEADQRRLTMLFHLRCGGHLNPSDEEVVFLLRIEMDSWLTTKQLFIEKGFIDESNRLLNWEKRQYESDTSTERVRKYREKSKTAQCNDDETLLKRSRNVTVTAPDTDTDTEADTEAEYILPPAREGQSICDQVAESYHGALPSLPKFQIWSSADVFNLKSNFEIDPARERIDFWRDIFQRASRNRLLSGREPPDKKRDWKPCLPWFLKPDNATDVVNGKYPPNLESRPPDKKQERPKEYPSEIRPIGAKK